MVRNASGSASAAAVSTARSRKTVSPARPHTSMLTVPGSIPMTRGASLSNRLREVIDRLGVENGITRLEQPRDTALVDLGLEAADADRAEHGHTVAHFAIVVRLDAFDAERRHGA